jgi:hypothetical protein
LGERVLDEDPVEGEAGAEDQDGRLSCSSAVEMDVAAADVDEFSGGRVGGFWAEEDVAQEGEN